MSGFHVDNREPISLELSDEEIITQVLGDVQEEQPSNEGMTLVHDNKCQDTDTPTAEAYLQGLETVMCWL